MSAGWTLSCLLSCALAATAAGQAKPPRLEDLEARAHQDSLDPEAHFRLATGYYRAKRWVDEERELRQALAIDPRYAPAYLWLGDLPFDRRPKLWNQVLKGDVPQDSRGDVDQSYQLWQQGFYVDPLADFRVMGTSAPPEDMITVPDYGAETTEYLLVLGLGAFGATRYELAYSGLDLWAQRAYANQPQDSIPDFLFLYRGLAAGHLRAFNRAVADLKVLLARSLKAEGSDSLLPFPMKTNDYRYTLGVLYQMWGKPWDAVHLYEDALGDNLGLYMAHVRLAAIYRSLKLWDRAVAEARRAIETNPADPTCVLELGVILDEAGKPDSAASALEQAVTANPRNVAALYRLGLVEQEMARPEQARQALTRFVATAPAARYSQELADANRRLTALGH